MNKKIVKESLTKILVDTDCFDEKLIEKYFSEDYVQTVNNVTIHYADFVRHLKKLKSAVKEIFVEFNAVIGEGSTVFTNHTVTAKMQNDTLSKTKIISEFRVKDGKIYYCDELTKLIEGSKEDEDLGSRI